MSSDNQEHNNTNTISQSAPQLNNNNDFISIPSQVSIDESTALPNSINENENKNNLDISLDANLDVNLNLKNNSSFNTQNTFNIVKDFIESIIIKNDFTDVKCLEHKSLNKDKLADRFCSKCSIYICSDCAIDNHIDHINEAKVKIKELKPKSSQFENQSDFNEENLKALLQKRIDNIEKNGVIIDELIVAIDKMKIDFSEKLDLLKSLMLIYDDSQANITDKKELLEQFARLHDKIFPLEEKVLSISSLLHESHPLPLPSIGTDKIIEKEQSNDQSKVSNNIIINQDLIIKLNEDNQLKHYIIQEKLGEGSAASVFKVLHKDTKEIRAMKSMRKNCFANSETEILNEINILKKLDHPNILKIYEFYSSINDYFIITDYCKYGDLFEKILDNAPFNEKQVAYIAYQILSAVNVCHSLNIIHRDLKPENILIESIKEGEFYDIKVIDFGAAKIFVKNKEEKARIGSSYYIAPEVLNKNYNEKCDLWSVGVIIYILLSKLPPFNGINDEEIFESIKLGKYDLESPPWDNISKQAKNLINMLLEKNIEKRLSAEMALKNDWFNETKAKELLFGTAKRNIKEMLHSLSTFKPNYKLEQIVIAFIVHNINQSDEIKRIYSAFQLIDENGDGRISKDELIKGLQVYDPNIEDPKTEVDKIFETIDTDHNGFLEFEEFARVLINKKQLLSDDIIKFTFDFFDKDGNGQITVEELANLFGKNNEDKIREMVSEIDLDKNGKIDYFEFKEMMIKILV